MPRRASSVSVPVAHYQPSDKILERYANVLVNFALNSGEGVRPGEVILCQVPDTAKPLAKHLWRMLLLAGAQPMLRILPTGFDRDFFELANNDQLTFFPHDYYRARVDLVDHQIGIIADPDPFELHGIDPEKIVTAQRARDQLRQWVIAKENQGKLTWTIGLWGVEAKAKLVGLTLEEYWDQIIKACFLDKADPVAQWQSVFAEQEKTKTLLNAMKIEWLHIKGPDVDLRVKLGAERKWNGGSGRNIPSFEIFTSPDWRGTSGWIAFNQPLYRYGHELNGIRLEFENGLVTKANAKQGKALLQEMLRTKNADRLGEFSLTDKRLSRITHVMAETLFDENIGGPFGNMHVAIGMAYRDCYMGNPAVVTDAQWEEMGYNNSVEHTDMITTEDRTVTATLADGTERIIYHKGKYVVE